MMRRGGRAWRLHPNWRLPTRNLRGGSLGRLKRLVSLGDDHPQIEGATAIEAAINVEIAEGDAHRVRSTQSCLGNVDGRNWPVSSLGWLTQVVFRVVWACKSWLEQNPVHHQKIIKNNSSVFVGTRRKEELCCSRCLPKTDLRGEKRRPPVNRKGPSDNVPRCYQE